MKKQMTFRKSIALVTCLTIGMGSGYAQYWKTTGNSYTDTSNFIGTIGNVPLKFKTWGYDRMIIAGNGNIGIGTTTPVNNLDVYNETYSSTIGIKSKVGNTNLLIDKGKNTSSGLIVFKTNGVAKWQAGMLGGENFTLKSMDTASNSFAVWCSSMYLKSSASAAFFIDRQNTADNGLLVYRTNGVGKWQQGMIANNNFVINDLDSNTYSVNAAAMNFNAKEGVNFYTSNYAKPRIQLSR